MQILGRVIIAAEDVVRVAVNLNVGAHAEIWDAGAWNAYAESNEETYAEMEQEVIPGLF